MYEIREVVKPRNRDFYNDEEVEELMENDEITPEEEAFMLGWIRCEQRLAE